MYVVEGPKNLLHHLWRRKLIQTVTVRNHRVLLIFRRHEADKLRVWTTSGGRCMQRQWSIHHPGVEVFGTETSKFLSKQHADTKSSPAELAAIINCLRVPDCPWLLNFSDGSWFAGIGGILPDARQSSLVLMLPNNTFEEINDGSCSTFDREKWKAQSTRA